MGFGFTLLLIFVILPLAGLLLIAWGLTRNPTYGRMLGFICMGIFGLMVLSETVRWLSAKTILDKSDYHGEYVINRDYFRGKQTDWQYNHYRFEITEEDSLIFYVTDEERIIKIYRGTITTTTAYPSARLIVNMQQPTHHIMETTPTTYRSTWDFYLVFRSAEYHNVFFKKGKWKPIR